ncbi:ABC transporter ATP-binding protein [Noviherbaspirillum saxi]|uniref:ABC transporter ATP-binding protein n=1 Tax=Noviherbaspirillum saxi TaxID=2320863 RepID=A0A3A3G1X9_9BURK|nr:ABC transporter ATP-binding protein [Noviherbaspirillum saxi]RJF92073.1 ABC transporter ATP-binding protein [Noviherbaspirillum saxi]
MSLHIRQLRKTFGEFVALDDIDLAIGANEFVCLLGPSGCGKTTLLRIIAGLLEADSGSLTLGGRDLVSVPARERGFGIVFQSYSLFPHMSVAENVGYGLRIRNVPAEKRAARVRELLTLVKLPDFAERFPGQLSGGQQQRVALARALAVDPSLILLDEPLSALDARVRSDLRRELRELQRRLGIPTLMVTHDQEEAMALADVIVCMNHGRIEQMGTPEDLYLRPRTRFVADFMGHSNLLPLDWLREAAPHLLRDAPREVGTDFIEACIRPEYVALSADPDADARVIDLNFLGSVRRARVLWRGRELLAELSSATESIAPGDAVRLDIDAEDCAWVQG